MLWFKHFANMFNETRVTQIVMEFGMAGYGFLNFIHETIVGSLSTNDPTFKLRATPELIAFKTGMDVNVIHQMLERFVAVGLLQKQEDQYYCYSLLDNMDTSMVSNPRLRQLIKDARVQRESAMKASEKVQQTGKRRRGCG